MEQNPWEVRGYEDENGERPLEIWMSALDSKTRLRIEDRLDRLPLGNFGDHKAIGKGVYELRLFFGPGYRIYYAIADRQVVLLLAGGDKKSQSRDIKRAQEYWNQYRAK